MGQIRYTKIIILILCFVLTSVFIYRTSTSMAIKKQLPLSEALANIKGWTLSGVMPLGPKIVKSLELDDYVNQNHSNGYETVSLYIGYYLTTKKIGAAHSPLVCFPGQGWIVSNKEKKVLSIGEDDLHLMSMIITRGQTRELVLYWFQALDKTSSGTFFQKIYTLRAKLFHSGEDNAFVRVSVPMEDQNIESAFQTGTKFIETFYPCFLDYVKGNYL